MATITIELTLEVEGKILPAIRGDQASPAEPLSVEDISISGVYVEQRDFSTILMRNISNKVYIEIPAEVESRLIDLFTDEMAEAIIEEQSE